MAEHAFLPESDDALAQSAAAIAVAFDAARDDPAIARAAAAFLEAQRALVAEQRHHMREQLTRLKVGTLDQRLSVGLKILTAFVGLAAACVLGLMVWDAAGSGGLVIQSFAVPPDLAARGLSGQVVASKVLDRLAAMQAETTSQRAPRTYANYWGDDIKVEIPETGISLGELDRVLRARLGHATEVSGEVVRTAAGLQLTARADGAGSATVSGPEAEIDRLIGAVAENVYRLTQPYLYGAWLAQQDRRAEAEKVYRALSRAGPAAERAWGYLGLSNEVEELEGEEARIALLHKALALVPRFTVARENLSGLERLLSRPEQAIADGRMALALTSSRDHGGSRGDVMPQARAEIEAGIDDDLADFQDARRRLESGRVTAARVDAEIGLHDLDRARALLALPNVSFLSVSRDVNAAEIAFSRIVIATGAGDWAGALAQARTVDPLLRRHHGIALLAAVRETPWLALAHAKLGNSKTADALIAATPPDCYVCLRLRARVAEAEDRHGAADFWFARAVAAQPSIPFADTEWGEALLARGELDAAIAKFGAAHAKGPHFADPLELWGEALIAKNRSDLALARFEGAAKYAPAWGRLHLKWGEALLWAGRKAEARRQFGQAAALDLTDSERRELNRVSRS